MVPKTPIHNLVFSGAAAKIFTFVGALKALEGKGLISDVKGFAGTSSGSVIACLLAVGYSPDELETVCYKLDWGRVLRNRFGMLQSVYRLFTRFGLYDSGNMNKMVSELIASKTGTPDTTFADLPDDVDLCITGTRPCGDENYTKFYRKETYPTMRLADAVAISCSIPGIFAPTIDSEGHFMVDGSVTCNLPTVVFADRPDTFALRATEMPDTIDHSHDHAGTVSLFEYISSIIISLLAVQYRPMPSKGELAIESRSAGIFTFAGASDVIDLAIKYGIDTGYASVIANIL